MKKKIIKLSSIIIGMAILAYGMYNIHYRCELTEGGVLGATLLIEHWFHVSPSISSFVIDIFFFGLGTFVLGKTFMADSLLATTSYSVFYALYEYMGFTFFDLSQHMLLASIIGALFVGTGTGLAMINDTASGGDDALALIVNKCFNIKVSTVYIVSDAILLMLSLTYIALKDIIYSLISVILSSLIIECLRSGKKKTHD